MRVITWNIAEGRELDGENPPNTILPLIAQRIQEQNANLVLLKEVAVWSSLMAISTPVVFGAIGGALFVLGLMEVFKGKSGPGAALIGSGVTVFGFGMAMLGYST